MYCKTNQNTELTKRTKLQNTTAIHWWLKQILQALMMLLKIIVCRIRRQYTWKLHIVYVCHMLTYTIHISLYIIHVVSNVDTHYPHIDVHHSHSVKHLHTLSTYRCTSVTQCQILTHIIHISLYIIHTLWHVDTHYPHIDVHHSHGVKHWYALSTYCCTSFTQCQVLTHIVHISLYTMHTWWHVDTHYPHIDVHPSLNVKHWHTLSTYHCTSFMWCQVLTHTIHTSLYIIHTVSHVDIDYSYTCLESNRVYMGSIRAMYYLQSHLYFIRYM